MHLQTRILKLLTGLHESIKQNNRDGMLKYIFLNLRNSSQKKIQKLEPKRLFFFQEFQKKKDLIFF